MFGGMCYRATMIGAAYTLPLRIRRVAEAFVVEDAASVTLAHVYVEDDARLRAQTRRVTVAEGREIARVIARALTAAAAPPATPPAR